jgi:hypothetical protein
MNQILEGTTKVDGTPNGLDQGYAHVGSSQAPTIENDDTSSSQVGNAPPQSPPSTIPTFDIFYRYIRYGTQGNIAIESPHTRVANLPSVSSKVVGNKRCRLSDDMASTFKKLIKSF